MELMQLESLGKYELDTPALLIDLDVLERNISVMADYFKGVKAGLRPHIKTHKTPIIAHKQLQAGAMGITCQKLGEAEVMAAAGIRDILIANQIVGACKIRRLVNLAKHANVIAGVDNLENAKSLSSAALKKGIKLNVAMEISMGRCGVEAGKPALALAKEIVKLKGLRFRGIWEHGAGWPDRYTKFEDRKRVHTEALKPFLETKDMLEDAGIDVEIVSGGYTATYNITAEIPGMTEVQPGSYVFMDRAYKALEGLGPFDCALTVLTTVISRPARDRAITDAGLKAVTPESGTNYSDLILPQVKDAEGIELYLLSEEHGWLRLKNPSRDVEVGDKLELIPSHCCTTVNLHDRFYGIRDGKLETIWDISARGKVT